MRKAWSTRARRWLKKLPQELLEKNPWKDSTKKVVRNWVKENVNIKGEDAILWGKWEEDDLECERLEEGTCPKPYWTEKQMRRRGEPMRKRMRRESMEGKQRGRNEKGDELSQGAEGGTHGSKKEDDGGKVGEPVPRNGRKEGRISSKEQKLIKAERRERWKVKKAMREKNKKERERKKQEIKEEMIRKGRETTRKQYTLRLWATGGRGGPREGGQRERERERWR